MIEEIEVKNDKNKVSLTIEVDRDELCFGVAGPTGLPGEKGEIGPTGPRGNEGAQGNIGPTGPKGIDGKNSSLEWEDLLNKPVDFNPSTHFHKEISELENEINFIKRESNEKELIDIRKFGAVGDWKPTLWQGKDNTAAFQAAIDFSNDTGRTIFIPPGRYRIDGTLYLKNYVSFEGTNRNNWGKAAGDDYAERDHPSKNFNEVEIFTGNSMVFQHFLKDETKLGETSFNCTKISFLYRKKFDSPRPETTFFHKIRLMRSNVINSTFNGYDLFLLGAMKNGKFENNIFTDIRGSVVKGQNIEGLLPNGRFSSIVDSFIINNGINGTQRKVDNVAFDIYYSEHSVISNNFIDFFEYGFKINNCDGVNITDNIFQYMKIAVDIKNSRSLNVSNNIFGLGMNRAQAESHYYNHANKWQLNKLWFGDKIDKCIGINIAETNRGILVTNNLNSNCDLLINVDSSNLTDSILLNNVAAAEKLINIQNLKGNNNQLPK